jgi:hypothetical protein
MPGVPRGAGGCGAGRPAAVPGRVCCKRRCHRGPGRRHHRWRGAAAGDGGACCAGGRVVPLGAGATDRDVRGVWHVRSGPAGCAFGLRAWSIVQDKVRAEVPVSTSHAVHDVFGPGAVVERIDGEVTPVAGVLEPAQRDLDGEHKVSVDHTVPKSSFEATSWLRRVSAVQTEAASSKGCRWRGSAPPPRR